MSQAKVGDTKVKGCKKCGRGKRKLSNTGNPLSLYVRNKISATEYFKLTNQAYKSA